MALLGEGRGKAEGRRSWGISPKEMSLVTGNVVETICQVLCLVGPVFARADDSLMPQKSLSLPLCSQPCGAHRQETCHGRRQFRGGGRITRSPPSLHPPPVCARMHVHEGGGEQVPMG